MPIRARRRSEPYVSPVALAYKSLQRHGWNFYDRLMTSVR